MKLELTRQEMEILIAWSEEATKGKFNLGDDPAGMTWEEENLIGKIRAALVKSL